ncbi:MAG: oligosaccharide flippase family protein [Woeseiaceae bacterium]|nr:oligosaccharide flippase family protein [Gammaproteobacteria bacterium]NNK25330.1 oligosaccharide flippase family protein [Woeseiaceae bacterium]
MSAQPAHRLPGIFLNSAFVFACRITGAALVLVLQVMLARWMGAAEVGVYVLAFSWCILLAAISTLGLASTSLRIIGQAVSQNNPGVIRGFLRRSMQVVVATSLAVALIGAVAALSSGGSLPGGEAAPFLWSLASVPIVSGINVLCVVAVAFQWFGLAHLPTLVFRPAAILAIIALVWAVTNQLTASTVLLVQFMVLVATLLILVATLTRRLPRQVAAASPVFETRTWMQIALPLLIIELFSNFFPEIMLILLGMHVPSDQVAIFNASYRLAMVVTFGLIAIDAVTSPIAARLYAAREINELQSVVARATRLGFWSSLAAVAGFAILGTSLLGLFGPEFVAGYDAMIILLMAQLLRSAAGPVIPLLSVTGHQQRCLAVFGSALFAVVVLVFILVPTFGIRGGAVAVFLVTLLWTIWLHRLVVAHIGIRPSIFGIYARG